MYDPGKLPNYKQYVQQVVQPFFFDANIPYEF